MDNKQEILTLIEELAHLMQRHQLTEIEASIGELSAKLSRSIQTQPMPTSSIQNTMAEDNTKHHHDTTVLAPTLGTYYAKASPHEKDFTTLHSHVQKGQTLGLIESMKVFHPIHAPCSGTITHINVEHGHSVEYHQCLMTIKEAT